MDVHQAEVEIFSIVAAVGRLVVILEPICADDVRDFEQALERIAESGGAFFLGSDHRIRAVAVFVAAAVVSSAQVELADENRPSSQSVERVHIKPRETAVVPTRVEIAGNGVHVARARAGDFRIRARRSYFRIISRTNE